MKFFRYNGSTQEEADRIGATDLEAAFKSEGQSGLYQFVNDRWFKARVREDEDGEYELENWVPVGKDDLPGALADTVESKTARRAAPSRGQPSNVERAVMQGKLDPNSGAAKEVADGMKANQSLQARQQIAGAGQPAEGSSTPNATSQEAQRESRRIEENMTGIQQNDPKKESGKPAAPSPVVNPPKPAHVAAPGIKPKEGEK